MTDEEILRRRKANEEYWQARARLEEKWMKANLADDAAFNKVIEDYYQKALQGIAKSLSDQYTRFAGRDGLTMDEAKEKVKSTDIKDYEQEAADLVERSKQIFKKKGSVDYSDFSDEENEHMRLYNATMRINRLEYLKSQIGLEMVDSGMKLSKAFGDKLGNDYIAEVKRQAGILTLNLDPALLDNKNVLKQIFMNTNQSDFSHRLWANQDALKARLDIGLTNMLIQGWNPNKMAGGLKKMLSSEFKKATYATQRLARTESARVQFAAQMDSFNKYGFDYVQWHAEPSACKDCQYIAESGKEGKGIYKIDDVPSIPAHPNCRCSVSAYYSQAELDSAVNKEQVETVANSNDPDELMPGVKRGKPMSVEEADSSNANPMFNGTPEQAKKLKELRTVIDETHAAHEKLSYKYMFMERNAERERLREQDHKIIQKHNDCVSENQKLLVKVVPYRNNCQRAAPAYELRRRGYDVTAMPNKGFSSEEAYRYPKNMWIDPETGYAARAELLDARNNKAVTKQLNSVMKPGERGTIDWAWAGRGNDGHIINVERTDDGVLFIDAQSGKIEQSFEEYMGNKTFKKKMNRRTYGVAYERVDDKIIDLRHIDVIVKGTE
ncbi:toxin glutamine deamidase domain-containing protein [Lacticaseibacillus paracasei]|uniref:toxin glutamine deamidase domain-containing protein n=1 Tax=Lacticaseibacillus paracasei TaxID=1597 RepID=UPI002A5AE088|nr:toxin glutamine deamidase domain-containing protein [Lacticaseibacillus paracasei]MDY0839005.1 toxin glutamine deamidase domain-containing protein [Lacticaseibacillus paracasei]